MMTEIETHSLLFQVEYDLLEGEDLHEAVGRLSRVLALTTGVHDARYVHPPAPGQLSIPDEAWRTSDEPGDTRRFSVVYINGHPFHADAWPVKKDVDPQQLDGLYPEDLDSLCRIHTPSGHFNTLTICGRECVVVIFPFS